MPLDPKTRASIAANIRWGNTRKSDRQEQLAKVRSKSPTTIDFWISQVESEPNDGPDDVRARATNRHRAYMKQLGSRGGSKKKAS